MILVDREIREAVRDGSLVISKFSNDCVQPATYDLRIGEHIFVPTGDPSHPIDISTNGSIYKLPPYGTAVLTTYEDLELPDTMAGRIGLKSGLARRGLFASTGPQIDPGFKGKLLVSVFNLTAASHIFTFLETFLTIEFHTLREPPDNPYKGEYQGKYTITPDVAETLARLEGLSLAQMQAQFTELALHVKQWTEFAPRVDEFLSRLDKHTRAIEELAQKLGNGQQSLSTLTPRVARELSHDEATKEIVALFRENKRLYYSDIAERLNLDFSTVIRICDELEKQGLIEGNGKAKGAGRSKKKGN